MRTNSDRIGTALFGKAKRVILANLFGSPERRFFVRELARLAALTPSTLTRDLKALVDAGIIERSAEGRQVYYRANDRSPVFDELRGLITKTFGIAETVRAMLSGVEAKIRFAAIYGSIAKGSHGADSDVDVLVVGDVSSSEFADELLQAQRILGRPVNPTVYSSSEFPRAAKDSSFLDAVLGGPMLFVIGGPNELRRARQGKAQ
jgi:uncharacterized protein